jgi:hypothetical protein
MGKCQRFEYPVTDGHRGPHRVKCVDLPLIKLGAAGCGAASLCSGRRRYGAYLTLISVLTTIGLQNGVLACDTPRTHCAS